MPSRGLLLRLGSAFEGIFPIDAPVWQEWRHRHESLADIGERLAENLIQQPGYLLARKMDSFDRLG